MASKVSDFSAANVTRDYPDEGCSRHSVGSAFRIRGKGKYTELGIVDHLFSFEDSVCIVDQWEIQSKTFQ